MYLRRILSLLSIIAHGEKKPIHIDIRMFSEGPEDVKRLDFNNPTPDIMLRSIIDVYRSQYEGAQPAIYSIYLANMHHILHVNIVLEDAFDNIKEEEPLKTNLRQAVTEISERYTSKYCCSCVHDVKKNKEEETNES